MTNLAVSDARKGFAEVVKEARRGERFALSHHGRVVAAVVSAEDLEFLEMVEDHYDRRAIAEAKADVEANGSIPWEQIKSERGL